MAQEKMKTDKYMIEFIGLDTLQSIPIALTKSQFAKHLENHKEQARKSEMEDTSDFEEYTITYRCREKECTGHVTTSHWFTIGSSDIVLTESHCKAGYHFTK